MKSWRLSVLLLILLTASDLTLAQGFGEIKTLWQQTIDAVHRGEKERARQSFGEFNTKVRTYVTANGRSWQIEYLIGSLNCQFPESRVSGANLLRDVLQTSRDLDRAGETELQRQLAVCTAPAVVPNGGTRLPDPPQDLFMAAAHFQMPGVRGDMKGGYRYGADNESAATVNPMQTTELQARRVELTQPQKALDGAMSRLPPGATGAVVEEFAVATVALDKTHALGIGNCLKGYMTPLRSRFDIEPANFMVTVYAAKDTAEVYDDAARLHGMQLPRGVVAYSVPDDMSLVAVADPASCGSAAHELVHLLIKRNFPMSPAWLEEGLASEVAVAAVSEDGFHFNPSWRDEMLRQNLRSRPSVAALLEASWSDFNTNSASEMQSVAATQAMAAVFIRYLDAKGKLPDIYFTVRDHHVNADLSEYKSYAEIVEEKLGMSVAEIDQDFAQWFGLPAPDMAGPELTAPCQTVQGPEQRSYPCKPEIMNQANRPPQ